MNFTQFWYLPLSVHSFFILVVLFFVVFVLLPLRLIKHAYEQLGVSPAGAVLLLFASLIGSYINIPLAVISQGTAMTNQAAGFFGMHYQGASATDWGGTVLAINVGGAVIPVILSAYLLTRWQLWLKGLLATVVVAAICYWFSSLIPGVGIAVPAFVPATAAIFAALILLRERPAPLAYIAGSLGTLIGADLLNFDKLAHLQAPIVSIGGAGTFDGIFVTGIVAVLITSIPARWHEIGSRSPFGGST